MLIKCEDFSVSAREKQLLAPACAEEGVIFVKYLYIYLAIINIVSFVTMGIDKRRALRHRWRIPERVLFLLAIFGGSTGALLGMWLLWHKVRKKLFAVGLPILLMVHLLVLLALKFG